jgi:hypothetical protein
LSISRGCGEQALVIKLKSFAISTFLLITAPNAALLTGLPNCFARPAQLTPLFAFSETVLSAAVFGTKSSMPS